MGAGRARMAGARDGAMVLRIIAGVRMRVARRRLAVEAPAAESRSDYCW
jgi:hypothetical protein